MASTLSVDTLRDIQGFITSGYGHLPRAAYLFVRIEEPARGREWLARVIPLVTTAAPWPTGEDGRKVKPKAAVNIAFTCEGLAALGLPAAARCTFPVEFQEGMVERRRSAILGDTEESAPDTWEVGGPGDAPVHAMLIVHGETAEECERACRTIRESIAAAGGGVSESAPAQSGGRPEGGHEPFGFRDGISQPAIQGITGEGVPTGEFILGYANHYGVIPPGPVVDAAIDAGNVLPALGNPYHAGRGLKDLGMNGTYVVYRKLQQDVAGFWQFMRQEAVRALGREDAAYTLWIASRCMGRWPSGAPVVLAPDRDDPALGRRDDFLYRDDVDGLSCPLGAHVRRTHPRDVIVPYAPEQSLSMSEAHRLLRRARSYGPTLVDGRALRDPGGPASAAALSAIAGTAQPCGIHFFCVNASIASQFEFVQQNWCNNPRFGGLYDNKDPIAGDNARTGRPPSHMTIPREPADIRTDALPRFVTVRGGLYLFMPSLRAMRLLSARGEI